MPDALTPSRRIELVLRKPWFALYWGVRPTLVIEGRSHPAQWGTGTWKLSAEATTVGVFLFTRVWRFGAAELVVGPDVAGPVRYGAPVLPFLRGRLTAN